VRYDISYQPDRNRWYLDASWQTKAVRSPTLDELRRSRALGVDLNAEHLDCWVLDASGNPVGSPHTIPLHLDALSASTREGRLRAAIAEILRLAQTNGCRSIVIEDLDFADARQTGRETLGRGTWAPRQVVPQDRRGDAGPSFPNVLGRNGRQRRALGDRGRSRLDLQVGTAVLADPAPPHDQIVDRRHPPSRGGSGNRQTWPGRRGPATARCARSRPEDRGWRATGQAGPAAP
jgi:hypothetical protein